MAKYKTIDLKLVNYMERNNTSRLLQKCTKTALNY